VLMRDMEFSGFAAQTTNPRKAAAPETNVQVRLPPGVMGLRLLFEDNQIISSIMNPVKWEKPMIPIGNSDENIF